MPTSAEAQERFEQEQRAYWQQRDELLQKYAGKWVALVGGASRGLWRPNEQSGGRGVAQDRQRPDVCQPRRGGGLRAARAAGCQGCYDFAYTPPMPTLTASVRNVRGGEGTEVTFVVDTGADLTLLQNGTADQAGLWNDLAGQVRVAGIGGQPERRRVYNALVRIAGQSVLATADCREDIGEDILGRDVINEFSMTLCQKRDQVEFEQA